MHNNNLLTIKYILFSMYHFCYNWASMNVIFILNDFRVGETPKYRKEDEDKFKVDKNLNGLWQYLTKRNIDMETFADLLVKGKIHILRKLFYSTKLNLNCKFFTKTGFFSSNQKNFFFNITFWQNFHAVVWIFLVHKEKLSKNSWKCCGW